jgi:hypothetical protein
MMEKRFMLNSFRCLNNMGREGEVLKLLRDIGEAVGEAREDQKSLNGSPEFLLGATRQTLMMFAVVVRRKMAELPAPV